MANPTSNAIGIGGGFIGFVGWLAPVILKLFGAVNSAMDLQQFMTIYSKFNWGPIYMLAFAVCVSFLVLDNWGKFSRWHTARKDVLEREWNWSLQEAINWVTTRSYQGQTIQYGHRYKVFKKDFEDKIKKGKLKLAGIKAGQPGIVPISKCKLRGLTLYCSYAGVGRDGVDQTGQVKDAIFIEGIDTEEPKEQSQVKWVSLMVDKNEIKKIWPGPQDGVYG